MGKMRKPFRRGKPSTASTSNKKSEKPKTTTSTNKALADYRYNTGSAKNASEFVATTKELLSYITLNMEDGDDVAEALKNYQEFDHEALAPKLKQSMNTTDAAVTRSTLNWNLQKIENSASSGLRDTGKTR